MPEDIAIIWNPTKTERDVLQNGIDAALEHAPGARVRWWETTPDDAGQEVAKQAVDAGATTIIAAGGDGTVRAVAEFLADAGASVTLGIVPLGTGNLLARNVGVPIGDVAAAFTRAVSGEPTAIDIGWVDVELDSGRERHAFAVMVGFGIDAHMITETDENLKDKAGWLAYVESLGRALDASEIVPFHITKDDEPSHDEEGHTMLIANCGTLQGGLALLPDADPTDGELDYVVLSAEGVGEWVGTLKNVLWDNGIMKAISKDAETTSSDSVSHGRAKRLDVTLPEPREFEIDGEEMGTTQAFTVSVQPSAVRVRA